MLNRVKLTRKGWDVFTGQLGDIEFENGVSVDPLTRRQLDRVSAVTTMELLTEDGASMGQAGPAARLIGGATIAAPLLDRLPRSTGEAKEAEQAVVEAEVAVPEVLHTRESLEKIADEKGIAGLRDIGKDLNVKAREIPKLIDFILKAQAKRQMEFEDAQAKLRELASNGVKAVESTIVAVAAEAQAAAPDVNVTSPDPAAEPASEPSSETIVQAVVTE